MKLKQVIMNFVMFLAIALIGAPEINGLFISRRPYIWSLYPWRIVTIFKLIIVILVELSIAAVITGVCIIPVTHAIDKLPLIASKVSKWYCNLVK